MRLNRPYSTGSNIRAQKLIRNGPSQTQLLSEGNVSTKVRRRSDRSVLLDALAPHFGLPSASGNENPINYEQIYRLDPQVFFKSEAAPLLRKYHDSPALAITTILNAEYQWDLGRFPAAALPLAAFRRHFGSVFSGPNASSQPKIQHLKTYIEGSLSQEFKVRTLEDWTAVTDSAAREETRARLASLGGLPKILQAVYPEHLWPVWKMADGRTQGAWWRELAEAFLRRDRKAEALVAVYITDLARQFGVKQLEDWYTVPITSKNAVWHRLTQIGGLESVLQHLNPSHRWEFQKSTPNTAFPSNNHPVQPNNGPFKITPEMIDRLAGFVMSVHFSQWNTPESDSRYKYLVYLATVFGDPGSVSPSPAVLYKINSAHLRLLHGRAALQSYGESIGLAAMVECPEEAWAPWRFAKSPTGWWAALYKSLAPAPPPAGQRRPDADIVAETALRRYLEEIGAGWNVRELKDWYLVPIAQMSTATPHLRPLGGLGPVLARLYPSHKWQLSKFGRSAPEKRTEERALARQLRQTLPRVEGSR